METKRAGMKMTVMEEMETRVGTMEMKETEMKKTGMEEVTEKDEESWKQHCQLYINH